MKRIIIVILFTGLYLGVHACTAVCIKDGGRVYLCKNLDYPEIDGLLSYTASGTPFLDAKQDLEWTTIYASVTFCYGEIGKPLGGMNECGLVIEELSCPPFIIVDYPGKMHLNEFQWVKYHLDCCSSVNEVVKMQDKISIAPEEFYMHYMIADSSGNVAIIEFNNGEVKIYEDEKLPFNVLSNNTYEESLRYYSKFSGFRGDMPLVASPASCDRFAWLAERTRMIDASEVSVEACYQLLGEVKQEDTQWQLVYDIACRKIYFVSAGSELRHCIDLRSFLYKDFAGILTVPL